MSGTSLDGIDVALVETDGEDLVRRGSARTYPYDQRQRARLMSALEEAKSLTERQSRPGSLAALEKDPDLLAARPVYARAVDREQLLSGRPQKFGTQRVRRGGQWELHEVDEAVTDADRGTELSARIVQRALLRLNEKTSNWQLRPAPKLRNRHRPLPRPLQLQQAH